MLLTIFYCDGIFGCYNYFNKQGPTFRFNKILIMNADVLTTSHTWIQRDVVSVGGKLIIGSPYNN
jgi:hypothetical protein